MPDTFTPEQISQILEEFFKVVGTRQYIGARYVPIFGRKDETSIEWDNTAPYEPLTIVLYQGNSYTSRQYVPVGVEITNQEFWAVTGNYNAQVEQYRRDVAALREDYTQFNTEMRDDLADYKTEVNTRQTEFETRITKHQSQYENNLNAGLNEWKGDTVDAFTEAIDNIPAILPSSAFSETNTVKRYIDAMSPSLRKGVMVVLGDSWSDERNDPANSWLKTVSDTLGMYAYVTNATAGMGFSYGGTPIPQQVSGAVTKVQAAGYTANDVTLVIAFGGVNDYRHGIAYGPVADGIRATYNNARSAFPNAKIQIIAGNTGNWDTMDTLDTDDPNKATSYAAYPRWIANIKNNLRNAGSGADAYCKDVGLWLNSYGSDADANIWNNDNLHPVQIGANIIAKHVLSILNGVSESVFYAAVFNAAVPTSSPTTQGIPLTVSYSLNDSHVHMAFLIDANEQGVSSLPSTIFWDLSAVIPQICGGTNNPGYRIAVNAMNFGYGGDQVRGYYNAATRRLTIYPPKQVLAQTFGTVDFDLMG